MRWWATASGAANFRDADAAVLVTGYMLASTPLVKRMLARLASLATSRRAIILVSVVSLAASWINWGFGLVVGALFASRSPARCGVDYRLLVASAHSAFIIWHGGHRRLDSADHRDRGAFLRRQDRHHSPPAIRFSRYSTW